jgi:hypothetical protein
MDKRSMEIGVSTGLVVLLILMILAAQIVLPEAFRPAGFVAALALFMIMMSGAGIRLLDLR